MSKINLEGREIQLVVFKIENEEYAIPIDYVKEIIMPRITARLPKTPDFMEGVINLRGHTIPVVDGRKKFNVPVKENDTETRIIVLEPDNHTIGLIVDSVSEVIRIKTENIDPPPVEPDGENRFLLGVGRYNDKLLILIDPLNLLDVNESENIKHTVKLAKDIMETAKNDEKLD